MSVDVSISAFRAAHGGRAGYDLESVSVPKARPAFTRHAGQVLCIRVGDGQFNVLVGRWVSPQPLSLTAALELKQAELATRKRGRR